jgi:hypothetical protein
METSHSDIARRAVADGALVSEPISPELVLVDPELAAVARASLSDEPPTFGATRASNGAAVAVAPSVAEATRAKAATARESEIEREYGTAPRRGGAVAVVFACAALAAVVVFVAARSAATPPTDRALESTVSAQAETAPAVTQPSPPPARARGSQPGPPPARARGSATKRQTPVKTNPVMGATPRAQHVRGRARSAERPRRSTARRPSNVLGVFVVVRRGVVVLRWQRPRDGVGVMIRRWPGRGRSESTVYEGNGTVYTDRTVRNGTVYRYLIITKGRPGNLSSGVAAVVRPRAST